MTALTMRFSAAACRALQPGDEIVCTRLDHDANVAPWLIAAARAGAEVRFAEPDRETLELPAAAVEAVLSRAHALGGGHRRLQRGRHDPRPAGHRRRRPRRRARASSSTPSTPRRTAPIDVAALGCDALACSAYKWFGPHIGILWARPELLADLAPDKLRPSPDTVPERWELGTLPFESLVGVRAAADFVMRARPRGAARPRGPPAGADGRGPRRDRRRDRPRRRARPHRDGHVHRRRALLARRRRAPGPRRGRRLARQLLRPRALALAGPRARRRPARRRRRLQRPRRRRSPARGGRGAHA